MQDDHVVYYELRILKEQEREYDTHDLGLARIMKDLNMWRKYLLGNKFELRTNSHDLNYLLTDQIRMLHQLDGWSSFVSLILGSST